MGQHNENERPGRKAIKRGYKRPLAHPQSSRQRIMEHVLSDGDPDKRTEEVTKKFIDQQEAELFTPSRRTKRTYNQQGPRGPRTKPGQR